MDLYCDALGIPFPSSSPPKYVIYYPRALLGNQIAGFVSAAMYGCLTGRILQIAPKHQREELFCNNGLQGAPCDLEMSDQLLQKYLDSGTKARNPEAWQPQHCSNLPVLREMLCGDGKREEMFVALSSCQYYGDLLRNNPYFQHQLPSQPYRSILRAAFKPSEELKASMISSGRHSVCVHIRFEPKKEEIDGFLRDLEQCAKGLMEEEDTRYDHRILAFTMHETVQQSMQQHFGEQVIFGNGDRDKPVDDVYLMSTRCVNILASYSDSTYVRMAVNLMDEPRMYPLDVWGNKSVCDSNKPPPMSSMEPTGDMWNGADFCGLKDIQCAVEEKQHK